MSGDYNQINNLAPMADLQSLRFLSLDGQSLLPFTRTEGFAADPGWTGNLNQAGTNNYRFWATNVTGGASPAGEAGGRVGRNLYPSYYADTNIGVFDLSMPMEASGELNVGSLSAWNGGVLIGHFSSADMRNFMGFALSESGAADARFYVYPQLPGPAYSLPTPLVLTNIINQPRTWSYRYDPNGGDGYGEIAATVSGTGGGTLRYKLTQEQRYQPLTFNAFGIGNQASDTPNAGYAETYIDNLTYSVNPLPITELVPLRGLTALRVRSLADNQVRSVIDLAGLDDLTILYLHNNKIADIQPLTNVRLIDNGDTSYSESGNDWLGDKNPAAFDGDYRTLAPVASTISDTATWSFTNLTPGLYDVQVTWPQNDTRAPAGYVVSPSSTGTFELTETNALNWGTFAPVDHAATRVQDELSRVKVGRTALRFETASGFDTGVTFPVAGNAHWNLSSKNFLTFWSYGDNTPGGPDCAFRRFDQRRIGYRRDQHPETHRSIRFCWRWRSRKAKKSDLWT